MPAFPKSGAACRSYGRPAGRRCTSAAPLPPARGRLPNVRTAPTAAASAAVLLFGDASFLPYYLSCVRGAAGIPSAAPATPDTPHPATALRHEIRERLRPARTASDTSPDPPGIAYRNS